MTDAIKYIHLHHAGMVVAGDSANVQNCWVRATDFDALAAKLAEVEAQRDIGIKDTRVLRKRADAAEARAEAAEAERDIIEREFSAVSHAFSKTHVALDTAEAALTAVYRLGLGDVVEALRTKRTHMYTTPYDEFVQTRIRSVDEMADMIEATDTPDAAALLARIAEGQPQ